MRETHLCTALWREILFIAACAAAAVLCVGLAFWFAVPQQPSQKQLPPDSTPLSEHWYVDLNTADAAALCTLPGVGPSTRRGRSGCLAACWPSNAEKRAAARATSISLPPAKPMTQSPQNGG